MEKGYLVVQTYLSEESYGVPGTLITLSDGRKIVTDENGFSPTVEFDTPNKEMSLRPGESTPYTSISITVRKEGYFTIQLNGIQIFATETTLQKVRMLPLPENGGEGTLTFDLPPQNL